MNLASVSLAAACLAAAASPALAAPSPPVAHIYLSVPQGTPGAALIQKGVSSAIAARKAKAGKVRVKLIVLDDAVNGRWDPQRTAENAARAAADPQAIAYIGEGNSGATAVAMPILNNAGIVHTSPVSTAVSLTAPENQAALQPTGTQTFFRPVPRDDQQAESLVMHIVDSGVQRIAIVDDADTYGTGLADLVAASAARRGVSVVLRQAAPGGQVDARALTASGADGVVVAMTPSTGGVAAVRSAHTALPSALIFSGDAMAQNEVAKSLGTAQGVMRLTAPATHTHPRQAARLGLGADASRPFVVFSYNATMAVLNATRRASAHGPVTRASVRGAVFDGSLVPGLAGPWQVRPDGNGVVGVFDELRMERGQVLTPGDIAGRKLRACGTKVCLANPTRRAKAIAPSSLDVPIDLLPVNLSGMDLETALMAVQSQRANLLEQQLTQKIQEAKERNDQLSRLTGLVVTLKEIRSGAEGSPAGALVATARLTPEQSAALTSPDTPKPANGAWTVGDIDAAVISMKRTIDQLSNSAQMDMLRLQSLSNKRNEAFDTMTNFVKKMQDSRSSIIGNMR